MMKLRAAVLTFLILILTAASSYAQGDPGLPCDGQDLDNPNCLPLDTWVGVLAAIAVIATAVHLQRKKQKELSAQ